MLFDTHAHYYDQAFDADRDAVLSALPGAGVGLVLCPGCDLPTSGEAIALAEQYPFLYAAAGVHPEDALGLPEDWLDQVRAMTKHPKVKAIGEIGLDYYWKEVPRDLQKEVFRAQLALAKGAGPPRHRPRPGGPRRQPGHRQGVPRGPGGLPLLLRQRRGRQDPGEAGLAPVLHRDHHLQERKKGPGGHRRRAHGAAHGGDRRPLHGPVPFRGKRCDSRYVYRMAETMAEIKGLTREEVERITTENGRRLFGIPRPEGVQQP